ncbi:MAG: sigma 54-interacting transcriptional regulator, partial [Bacteroidota bacterium]
VKPLIIQKRIHIESVTDYQSIFDKLKDFIQEWEPSSQKSDFQLHVNASPGTPQMHVVWLMLNASGYLPLSTQLWSTQYDKQQGKTKLSRIEFKPRTYLSEILQKNTRSAHGPNINPNDTQSKARKIAEEKLERYAPLVNVPLLILGERGVGKSTYVRKHLCERIFPDVPFAELACGTFREDLFRAELFGYEKGAFTGADVKKEGILHEFQEKGILFLDEVHDLSLTLQRDLIQVLQTGKYYPVGSTKPLKANFRLITASNLSLAELIQPDRLSRDFFDRIAHVCVEIPPLRECKEDIPRYWKAVWHHVSGLKTEHIWNEKLAQFLSSHELLGNFRDLQRLAASILSFHMQLRNKAPNQAISQGINEFEEFYKGLTMPSLSSSYFIPGKTYKEIITKFNKDLVHEAITYYGSINEASKAMDRSLAALYKDKKGGED